MDDAQQRHLARLDRQRRPRHFLMPLQQQLPQPMQHRKRQRAPRIERRALLGRLARSAIAADLDDRHSMHGFEQRPQHRRRIDAQIILRAQRPQRPRRIRLEQQVEQPPDRPAIRQAQHLPHRIGAHALAFQPAMRDRLVEDRQPVARRPFGRARDQLQRLRLGLDALRLDDMRKMPGQQVGRNAPQVEALAARQDRHRHLVHLGRRQQEFDVRGRLFQRLEQRVERRRRHHVHFVDDVDLEARRHRGIAHRLGHLAHAVDAVVRRGVDLDHVDMPPFGDRPARLAHPARIDRRPTLPVRPDAIECLGDQPRGRRLADPAHPGQQERMGEATALDGVAKRGDHRILADQLAERLRPIFARQHAVRLRGGRLFGDVEGEEGVGHCGCLSGWRRRCRVLRVAEFRTL